MVSAESSTIERPPTRTAALSGRSRVPPQVEQAVSARNCAYQRLALSEVVSRKRRMSRGRTPSQSITKVALPPFLPAQRTVNWRSPVPCSTCSRSRFGSFRHGTSKGTPSCFRICVRSPDQLDFCEISRPQGLIAPSSMVSASSGTTSSGSIAMREPRPLQSTHMPCGLLNEKPCGVSSGKEIPHSAHAIFSENTRSAPSRWAISCPPPALSACSTEPARRRFASGPTTMRSTTTST
jgi:hypothetical protein